MLLQLIEEKKCGTVQPPREVLAQARATCNPNHVYIITGGLGGFGMEFADFLIGRGARKCVALCVESYISKLFFSSRLVLCSRRGICDEFVARAMHFWRRTGVRIMARAL